MFAQAHYRVASKVRTVIEKESGYQLHPMFIYGNVKPDFTWKGIKQKHYIEEMMPIVLSDIQRVKESKVFEYQKRKRDILIGEICHFVTDFFTLPHNERWEFKHSFKPHVRYEREVNRLSKSGWDSTSYEPVETNLYSWLIERLVAYEGKGTPYNDLVFAEKACVEIVLHILKELKIKERITV